MPLSLPPPAELERRARIVAFVDTLLAPEYADRTYDHQPDWARGERLFSARSGEGDQAFVWFGRAGALVRGRHREKKAFPPERLFDGLPAKLARLVREPAFDLGGDSFATWWDGKRWAAASDPGRGGVAQLLSVLDGDPASFARYAAAIHEVKVDRAALAALYRGDAITAVELAKLAPAADARWAWALAKKRGMKTKGPAPKRWSAGLPDAPQGDAEFKVVSLGDDAMLVVANKVQLRARRAGLYVALIEKVRKTLRAAGAR